MFRGGIGAINGRFREDITQARRPVIMEAAAIVVAVVPAFLVEEVAVVVAEAAAVVAAERSKRFVAVGERDAMRASTQRIATKRHHRIPPSQ